MDLRSLTLGRKKPPALIVDIALKDGEPSFKIGWRTPTVADMRAAEAQKDNIGKSITLIRLLAVDPETFNPVYNEKDQEGLLSMPIGLMTALAESMGPVFPKAEKSAKGSEPTDSDNSSVESAAK